MGTNIPALPAGHACRGKCSARHPRQRHLRGISPRLQHALPCWCSGQWCSLSCATICSPCDKSALSLKSLVLHQLSHDVCRLLQLELGLRVQDSKSPPLLPPQALPGAQVGAVQDVLWLAVIMRNAAQVGRHCESKWRINPTLCYRSLSRPSFGSTNFRM